MDNENDGQISNNLNFRQKIVSTAKSLAEKLNKEIEKGNDGRAFMLALLLAAFKDFLDIIITITALEIVLPGSSFVIGLFLTSFLLFFMLGKGWLLKWRIKVAFWILGIFVDGIPAVSALPMNSLLVLYAWRLAKKRKKHAEIQIERLDYMSENKINELDGNISLLENDKYVENLDVDYKQKHNSVKNPKLNKTINKHINLVPFVGGAKMIAESIAGKDASGTKLKGFSRVKHGIKGATSLGLDFTGVGEVEKGAVAVGRGINLAKKSGDAFKKAA